MNVRQRVALVVVAALVLTAVCAVPAFATWPPGYRAPANGATVPRNAARGWIPTFQWPPYNQPVINYQIHLGRTSTDLDWWFSSVTSQYVDGGSHVLGPGRWYWRVYELGQPWSPMPIDYTDVWSFVVPANLSMALSPSSLSWATIRGGANPPPQTVTFNATGDTWADWGWHSYNDQLPAWVTETQIDSTRCKYSVSSAGLAVGDYTATMLVTMWYGGYEANGIPVNGSPYLLPVRLSVKPPSWRVSITRSPSRSVYTVKRKKGVANYTLSATLRGSDGTRGSGLRIYLQKSKNGKSGWKNTYTRATDGSGRAVVRFTSRKKGTAYYRWYVPQPKATSKKQTVVVK
jgi:hypothetical protein